MAVDDDLILGGDDHIGVAARENTEPNMASCPELIQLLEDEYRRYKKELGGHLNSSASVDTLSCRFCPFRKFEQKRYLVTHVDKYHKTPYYTAEGAAPKWKVLTQYRLIQALVRRHLFDVALTGGSVSVNLLQQSAQLIRDWNAGVTRTELDILERSNGLPVVIVVTASGPQLWLKSRTGDTCRISDKLYYTKEFEQLVISIALQTRGRVSNIQQQLWARWAEHDSAVPLLVVDKAWIRDVLHHIFKREGGTVQRTLHDLKRRATCRGEWVAVSHDATFKFLFSVIGQEKMAQKPGGLHAAHNFVGVTGACPGFSAQRTEGKEAFNAALNDLFTDDMRSQVRLLYSDSPNEGFLELLPNAVGCAEDSFHLVIRCQSCTGGKRTACTQKILMIQNKFLQALPMDTGATEISEMVYHGQNGEDLIWDNVQASEPRSDADWEENTKKPHTSYEDYAADLKGVALEFPTAMTQRGWHAAEKRIMLHVLQDAITYRHYMYLRNNSVFRTIAEGQDIKTGTTANEAEARMIKAWGECVYQQHQDRVRVIESAYGLYRMLGNSYNAVSNGSALRTSERTAVCILAGRIATGLLMDSTEETDVPDHVPTTRKQTRKPLIRVAAAMRSRKEADKTARSEATKRQVKSDISSKRRKLRCRLKGKVSPKPSQLKLVRKRRLREPRDSDAIRNSIDNTLGIDVD